MTGSAAAPAAGSQVAFLVGAGRSGTTLLQKLLCLHPRIAYISNYENRFRWFPDGWACGAIASHIDAKLGAWFDRAGNAYFIGRPWFKKLFPTPHEGESVFTSCGIPLTPGADYRPGPGSIACLRRRFENIRARAGARLFLCKRTANNRRVRMLSGIFPEARYVHLLRDGREVTQSLANVEWWNDHNLWWDGRTPLEMERDGVARLTVCARNWVREVTELQQQLGAIAPSRILELRFEQLLADPLAHLERVLHFLGLDFPADYRAAIESLQLRPMRADWDAKWDGRQRACVLAEAGPLLRQLGYAG